MMIGMQPVGRFAITNGRIVLPQAIVTGQAVVVEGNKIIGVAPSGSLSSDLPTVDVGQHIITPGLIDLHTHGALGHTFNEPTAEAFAVITEEDARCGVTALLATLATAPITDLVDCLSFCRGWMQTEHGGAQVLGMHLESPYISLAQQGALDPAHIRRPDDGSPGILLEHHDVLKIMVLAPELPGALVRSARGAMAQTRPAGIGSAF
jgi:N-acetylglucosamine-6-phosphate deacetylase